MAKCKALTGSVVNGLSKYLFTPAIYKQFIQSWLCVIYKYHNSEAISQ